MPAPFGPRTATVSPSRRVEVDAEVERSPSGARDVSGEPHAPPSQRSRSDDEHHDAHREQHEAEADRALAGPTRAEVHRERRGLGAALDVAGEGDRRAELAERAAHASAAPATSAGAMSGTVTRRNTVQRPAPRRRGGVLVAPVHRAQGGLDGDHEERHGHERLGHDRPVENVSWMPNES